MLRFFRKRLDPKNLDTKSESHTGSHLVGDQRDEAYRITRGDDGLTVVHADELELLRVGWADGDDHAPAVAELGEQRRRDVQSGGGDEDCIEGGMCGKAEGSVAGKDLDIGITERRNGSASIGGESRMTFDGENFRGKFGKQSSDVSRAGADFEDNIGRRELQVFEHDCDNIGLGDGLVVTDG